MAVTVVEYFRTCRSVVNADLLELPLELLRLSCKGCFCLRFVSLLSLFNNYIQQKRKKARQKRTHKSGVRSNPFSLNSLILSQYVNPRQP